MENCYFNVSNNKINVICVSCYSKNLIKKEDCWFWDGKIKGYGPFKYKCKFCNKIIYDGENEEN